jgi:hypothetical protein
MNQNQIKQAISTALLESLNDGYPDNWQPERGEKTWDLDAPVKSTTANSQDPNRQYENGKKWGVKDKLAGIERELDKYPPAFAKGYREVQTPSWWNKFNEKLTQLLVQLGTGAPK